MHDSNFHSLEELFIELCDAKIDHLETSKSGSGDRNNHGDTNATGSVSNTTASDNANLRYLALQEFWFFVGQEVSSSR